MCKRRLSSAELSFSSRRGRTLRRLGLRTAELSWLWPIGVPVLCSCCFSVPVCNFMPLNIFTGVWLCSFFHGRLWPRSLKHGQKQDYLWLCAAMHLEPLIRELFWQIFLLPRTAAEPRVKYEQTSLKLSHLPFQLRC